jgi:hypothetical protein
MNTGDICSGLWVIFGLVWLSERLSPPVCFTEYPSRSELI